MSLPWSIAQLAQLTLKPEGLAVDWVSGSGPNPLLPSPDAWPMAKGRGRVLPTFFGGGGSYKALSAKTFKVFSSKM